MTIIGVETIKIHRKPITIRSAALEDAVQLNTWWNDGRVMAHAGFPNGLGESLERTRELVARNVESLSQRCIIEIDGAAAGECSYRLRENEAELGFKICNPDFQNRGYGSQIVEMLIDFIFSDESINQVTKIERVVLDTNLNNRRAQHVYEKLGFVQTGIRYHDWKDQLGRPQSSVDYALTREAFYNRR